MVGWLITTCVGAVFVTLISDSFTFAKTMQNLDIDPNVFMCSFDVSSLFTYVSLDETIKICLEALHDQSDSQPLIPKDVFVELMKSATSSVEYSFNNTMYKQTEGVAMGSPLGSALANIFVGYYEEKLFSQMQKPLTYFRYVEDTFAIFDHKAEADEFLTKLNCLHPSLRFTFEKEKEKEKCLPFLDVYIAKTDVGFETSVYRKPTFTGQYLHWESFSPLKHKICLISTLVHRALMICTKHRLNGEIEIFVICLVFTSKCMLPVAHKDVLPTIQKSFVIYEYKCHCDSWYVEQTSSRLQDCIKQHVPQWLRQQLTHPHQSQPHRSCKRTNIKLDCDSAIDKHLLDNDQCALNYDNKRFSILVATCSSFHLNLLEAAYIKTRRLVLCRQKRFVYTLKLFR